MKKKNAVGGKYFGSPLTSDKDDAPELLDDFFRHGEVREGDRVIRRGRPPVKGGKEAVKLRLDKDVLNAYRASGPGWQTRINATLRRSALSGRLLPVAGKGRRSKSA